MRPLLLAALAAATVTPFAPSVQAHPSFHYGGPGCIYYAISDGTETAQTLWTGAVWVGVYAVDAATGVPAAVSIEATCELRINGAIPGHIVLESGPATGGTGEPATLSYQAHPGDVITMCTHVTVGGDWHKEC